MGLTKPLGDFFKHQTIGKFSSAEELLNLRIKHHLSHKESHKGGDAEIVAIAKCEFGMANDDSLAKMSCYESQVAVGTFNAETPAIKIKGGNYRWANTGDGYFTVFDVPIMAECPEGTKGSPYAVDKGILEEFRDTAQKRYNDAHFCASAFVGHNPDIPVTHPDFAGYVLPNRVGTYKLESGEKWTLFADLKLDKAKFELARSGKLPYTSPEVPWAKRRVAGLSFLDTQPPFFEFALFTLGDEVKNDFGKFEAAKIDMAKFMEEEKKEAAEGEKPGLADHIEAAIGKHMEKHVAKYMDDHMKKNGDKYFSAYMSKNAKMSADDPMIGKSDPLPIEPEKPAEGGAKMATDPKDAAKFTALESQIAEMQAKFSAQENEKKAVKLVEKIKKAFSIKILSPSLDAQIAKYSAEWAPLADGEKRADEYIEALKPSLKDKPTAPVNFGSGAPADINDPAVAKFAQEGPEVMEEAAKFAAQWDELKKSLGERMRSSKEGFIKNEMGIAKAKRDGLFTENGR